MTPEIYAIQGLAQLGLGAVNSFQAAQRQREARADYEKSLADFRSQDTSNLYANLENPYEDLTVNQQQAQFQAQQQQQGLANVMGNLQQAAGGSGIASLAQAMAQQQSSNLQRASASIGMQEQQLQSAKLAEASRLQNLEAQGAAQKQAQEFGRTETLFGMAQQRKAAADEARRQATQSLVGGIGELVGAAGGAAMAGAFSK